MNDTTTLQEPHASQPKVDLPAGYVIDDRFAVISKIGAGGMGAVYLAEDKRLRRRVAIKLISGTADETARKRFSREAKLMAGIRSPEIIQLHDSGHDTRSGSNYYVMEAHLLSPKEIATVCRERLHCPPPIPGLSGVSGEKASTLSLDSVLAGDRAVSEETAAKLALEILAALQLIHENEPAIVHRDLKPSNLIFAADGHLMLSDFGIAKAHFADTESTSTLTMLGAGPGTPLYAAPEQKNGGKITTATDFYAFGLVLYRMLTGGLPGTASTLLPSDVSSRVSRKWNHLLPSLLQRDPAKRLSDHEAVRQQLLSILADIRRRTWLRAFRRLVLVRGLPVLVLLAIAAVLGIRFSAHLGERRAQRAPEEQSRREAAGQKPKVAQSFHESLEEIAAVTNNMVVPRDGEPLVLHSGETMIVPATHKKAGEIHPAAAPWDGPRPSKITLDGGRILFSLPPEDVSAILATALKNKDSLLGNRVYLFNAGELPELTGKYGGTPELVAKIDIPIEITPNGGTIEADDRFVDTAVVRGKLTSADGSPVQVNFVCGALSTMSVDKDIFGPGVTFGPGRYFKLVDFSGPKPKIVRWVE